MSLSDQIKPRKDLPGAQAVFQTVVFYYKPTEIKAGIFKKIINVIFPYYSQIVFLSEDEAKNYVAPFLKELVQKGEINEEDVADEKKVQCCVQTCQVARLEVVQ